jgi:hypothetical protein
MRSSSVLAALGVATSALLVGWVLWLCGAGIDFTDEGFYLNWVSNPWQYPTSVSQFGFVYHPLYQLVDGQIDRLRQLNVLLLVGLGSVLAFALLRTARADPKHGRLIDTVAALVAGSTALAQLGIWLPTPNYNTLALQGLLLGCSGLVWTRTPSLRLSLLGWIAAGGGGALAFLGKPTTAAAFGLLALPFVFLRGGARSSGPLLGLLAGAGLLLGASLVIDGSPSAFAHRMSQSLADARLLTPHYAWTTIFRTEDFFFRPEERDAMWGLVAVLVIAALFAATDKPAYRVLASLAGVACAAATLGVLWWQPSTAWQNYGYRGLWMWAAGGAGALSSVALWLRQRMDNPLPHIALAAWLALIPIAYVIGTGNSYWKTAGLAACFWALAGIAAIAPAVRTAPAAVLITALAAQAVAAVLLCISAQSPYRQALPLRAQSEPVFLRGSSDRLRTDPTTASYMRALQDGARAAGMPGDTSIIDLTGRSPGVVYMLGTAPGQPWLLAGYPGSEAFATRGLSRVPCDVLVSAWLLTQPTARGALPDQILESFGARAEHYTSVLTVWTPPVLEPTSYRQHLLRPARDQQVARLSCEQYRGHER